jgi:beta-glucosidase
LKAGVDLEMPGPRARRVKSVVAAVRSRALDESVLNEAVRRILGIVFRAAQTAKGGSFDRNAHHALARRIAAEGMVLLKNDGILPLKGQQHIAVIGRAAKEAHFQGGGSSHINPTQVDSPFVELQKPAGDAKLTYADGYPAGAGIDQSLIDAAVNNARSADVALLYLALPESKESEGYDRTDLDLTPQQVALIKAVTSVQPKTVVILNNGAPVVMSEWINGPAAILEGWMMGQAGGGAIADVLYGKVNPSGKLAETFPIKLADTPAYINFPGGNGQVRYGEGVFIGYRYYDAKEAPVQFPFGYGMSYTTFAYKNPQVSAASFKDVDGLTVSVDVTNTGKVAGSEVVQVYVHDHKSRLARPPKELKGFAKVELQPGQTKTVTVALDFRAFAYYHPAYRQWITEDGEFDILIGASVNDIRCSQTVTLQSTQDLPSLLNRESTLRDWMEDPRGKRVLEPLVEQFTAQMRAVFDAHKDEVGSSGMETVNFIMELPLWDVFHFQEAGLLMPPEDLLDGLLAQVHGQAE